MTYLDGSRLARKVSEELRLPIIAEPVGRTETISLRIDGIDRPHGFAVHVRAGLQIVFADLVWDTFANDLVAVVSRASESNWQRFDLARSAFEVTTLSMSVRVNGADLAVGQLPPTHELSSLAISGQETGAGLDAAASAQIVATALLSLIVMMLPLDNPQDDSEIPITGFETEGGLLVAQSRRFERSRANRAIAILLHGTACAVCGFDFEKIYGDIGGGYIEVHHLLPVHLMEMPGPVNPSTDLVPLCSNCHRMAHRIDPPYTPDYLRRLVERTSQQT